MLPVLSASLSVARGHRIPLLMSPSLLNLMNSDSAVHAEQTR